MKYWHLWTVRRFWWLWGATTPIALIVLCTFLSLLTRGVGNFDILPWIGILLVVVAVMGGSVWLRKNDHSELAAIPLLLVLVPVIVCVAGSLLFSGLYMLVYLFGHGRKN